MTNNESQWLAKAQKGDAEAFTRLVGLYQTPVYNLCYRMLGNPNDAEDAAQETFMRVYKSLSHYDRNRSFITWLLSIASHYCIDQIRKRRLPTFSISDDEQAWLQPPDPGPLPERILSNREDSAKVQALLNQLKPKDRAAVIMRYWYDYSYDEIANVLSLTISAVKSRLHRARRELALKWQSYQKTELLDDWRYYESPAF